MTDTEPAASLPTYKRARLTEHLHTHPDHSRHYRAGHDFQFRSTQDIADEHELLHDGDAVTPALHRHGPLLRVKGEQRERARKTLDLKVTVSSDGADPDALLAKMDRRNLRLTTNAYMLKVTSAERADGKPFGLEAAFEEYWQGNHCEGDGGDSPEKREAREAFLYGVQYAETNGKDES